MSVSHSSTDQDHPETSTHPPTDTHAGKRQMHCHGSLNIRLACQDPDIHIDTHTVGEWYQSDGKGLLRLDGRQPIHSTGCLLTPCGSTWTQPPHKQSPTRSSGPDHGRATKPLIVSRRRRRKHNGRRYTGRKNVCLKGRA